MDIPTRKGQHILDAARVSRKITVKKEIQGLNENHYQGRVVVNEAAVRNCPRCKGSGIIVSKSVYTFCNCLGA